MSDSPLIDQELLNNLIGDDVPTHVDEWPNAQVDDTDEPALPWQEDAVQNYSSPPPIEAHKKRRTPKTPAVPKKLPYPTQCQLYERSANDFEWEDPFYLETQKKNNLKKRIEPALIEAEVVCPVCEDRIPNWVASTDHGACMNCSIQIYSHIQPLRCLPDNVLAYFVNKYLQRSNAK